jgi:hypothetical protein
VLFLLEIFKKTYTQQSSLQPYIGEINVWFSLGTKLENESSPNSNLSKKFNPKIGIKNSLNLPVENSLVKVLFNIFWKEQPSIKISEIDTLLFA